MKLLIFGSTGGTGRQLVEQALQQGHQVTAFARNPAKLVIRDSSLKILQGDVMNPDSVLNAMQDQDAVLSALGSPATKIGTVRSQGTKNIIVAMKKIGIRRLISQASLGYGDSTKVLDRTPLYFKYIIVPFLLKKGFADHALQEEHIRNSDLDWVIVRPGILTDGGLTGKYRHGFASNDKHITVKISRADVADFMLKQLTDDTYVQKTAGLSY